MKFDMSRAWNDAVAMIGANRELLLIIAGLFFFLPAAANTMMLPEIPEAVMQNQAQAQAFLLNYLAEGWPIMLIAYLVQAIGVLALLALLRNASKPTVSEAFKIGLSGFLPYFAATILSSLAATLIFIVIAGLGAASGIAAIAVLAAITGLILLIYAMIKFSLIGPVVAVDRVHNPIAAIRQSWRMTKGNSLRLLGFYMLLGVVYMVLAILVSGMLGILFAALGDGTAAKTAQSIVSGLVGAAASVVVVAILASVHKQLSGDPGLAVKETFS